MLKKFLLGLILLLAISLLFAFTPAMGDSQTPVELPRVFSISPQALVDVRNRLEQKDPALESALQSLIDQANQDLDIKPLSVMDKPKAGPSGDKHDYVSYADYYWPNPNTPNGLPYIRRDGYYDHAVINQGDSPRFQKVIPAIYRLALAYWFTGNAAYSEHAGELLRVWFLDPATRMNPNMKAAQLVLGDNTIRGEGLIEFRWMYQLVDALGLLNDAPGWSNQDAQQMHTWLEAYDSWLDTSPNAKAERSAENNHGTWINVQEAALLLYLGKTDEAKAIFMHDQTKRIPGQIKPDGEQPLEQVRNEGLSYCLFNLTAQTDLANLARSAGVDLWHFKTQDGAGIQQALDYILPYAFYEKKWPRSQRAKIDTDTLIPLLLEAQNAYGKKGYAEYLSKIPQDQVQANIANLYLPPQ
ncbi:MAG TPA: alginate lyase family protein [Phycisphaerae bacterium]|nr:alginate lyase family protein [Phycisphaerae bacterium]